MSMDPEPSKLIGQIRKLCISSRYRCLDCKFFKSSIAYCILKEAPQSYLSSPCEDFVFAKRHRFSR